MQQNTSRHVPPYFILALCPAQLTLQASPFSHCQLWSSRGTSSLASFLRLSTEHLEECWTKNVKNALIHLSAPVAGRIFSISQVDFARLIKSSSLMSCLTSPPSLLLGAYSPTGATGQTDCCPAGMGLAARQGPEAHSPWAFVWIWSVELEGVKQGEGLR